MFLSQPKTVKNSSLMDKQLVISDNLRSTNASDNPIFHRKKGSPPKTAQSIQIFYNSIHSYIETVEQKIRHLLETQSNQYKVVYQHYYKKFKDQLYDLKAKTLQQQKAFLQNDHVKFLGHQVSLLKQQSFRYKSMFDKIKKQNSQLRQSIKIYKKELQVTEQNNKNYIKQIKWLNSKNKPSIQQNSNQYINTCPNKKIKNKTFSQQKIKDIQKVATFHQVQSSPYITSLTHISSIGRPSISEEINQNHEKDLIKENLIQQKLNRNSFRSKLSKFSNRKSNLQKNITSMRTQISQKAEQQYGNLNISQWFMQCVKTINKQILHRKLKSNQNPSTNINNSYRELNSLQDFMKIDKIQVLKIFVSNPKIISVIFNLLKNQFKFQKESLLNTQIDKKQEEVTNQNKKYGNQIPNAKQIIQNLQKSSDININYCLNIPKKVNLNKNDIKQANQTIYKILNNKKFHTFHAFESMNTSSRPVQILYKKERNHTMSTTFKEPIHKNGNNIECLGLNIEQMKSTSYDIQQDKSQKMIKISINKISTNASNRKNSQLSYELIQKKKKMHTQPVC